MKAAQINEYGSADAVTIASIDTPTPGEGQVQVEVHAASLNPFDTMVRAGFVAAMIPALPVTLGGDISGVVAAVGDGVSDFAVGDEVYGSANAVSGASGALAEYAVTASGQLGKKPQGIDFETAAASVLVGVSALQAIDEHLKLKAGQKILIQGGGGGIGSLAIQLAKHRGAYVATTVSGADVDYVKSLGADQVINYETEDFTALLSDFDAIFDTTTGEGLEASLRVLRAGGVAVSMIASVEPSVAEAHKVSVVSQGTQVTTERLKVLGELLEQKVLIPRIAQIFSLEDIKQAFEARENGATGKIVVTLT